MKLTQRLWRRIAAGALAGCALMAWFGADLEVLRRSLLLFALYWSCFLILFLITIALVLLDIRYIRMQYALGERHLYRQVLADESFRTALREGRKEPSPGEVSPDKPNKG